MKNLLRKKIAEHINKVLDEEYPKSFDIEHFKTLTSFNKRIQYCQQHLERISSGSSRIVYKIDDEKVLKLARNKKGLAQNEAEIYQGDIKDLSFILTQVYDSNENNLWAEMEWAPKPTKAKFKNIAGVDFDTYAKLIHNHGVDNSPPTHSSHKYKVPKDITEWSWEDEFMYEVYMYIGSYDINPSDLTKLSSYGIVKRDGEEQIVIVDFGLTDDVSSNHYE